MPGERLTEQDRRQIAAGLADGLTYAAIARRLGRPTSTITREVMRNGGPNDYRAGQAHRASGHRARNHKSTAPASSPGADIDGRDPRVVTEVAHQLTELLVRSGLPQMMARTLAALFTTDSGSLTSAELVQRLNVSPASISKAVGYLESQELIKRERHPRLRAESYVIDDDVWYRALLASARVNTEIAAAAKHGGQLLGIDTPAGTRMENLSEFLGRVGDDLVDSTEHWRQIYLPRAKEGEVARAIGLDTDTSP